MSYEKDKAENRIVIVKSIPHKREVFGYAYVARDAEGRQLIDKSREYISNEEVLEKMAYDYVMHSRKGGVFHIRKDDGAVDERATLIESFVITPDKLSKMRPLPQLAWWVGFKVHDDNVFDLIKSGKLTQFSIHGTGKIRRTILE